MNSHLERAGPYSKDIKGLVEGFLGGNVEILYLENELLVVVYHFSQPELFPATVPVGFVSKNKEILSVVSGLIGEYLRGSQGFDKSNDCGSLSSLIAKGKEY